MRTLQILVVDDSSLVREKVCVALQKLPEKLLDVTSVNFHRAGNGLEALEILRTLKGQIQGIVCDWDMPEMNGVELVREIRNTPGCWRIPILMLTSMGQRGRVVEAMQAGMNDYMIKPFVDPELCQRVAAAISFDTMRVLVVDDSLMVRRIVVSSLNEMVKRVPGLNLPVCFEASNGREALDILQRKRGVDLIISDWKMPEMDGIEFINVLKKEPFTADIPVIMLTSMGDREAVAEALHAGVSGFIVKPFDQFQLLERILQLLKHKLFLFRPECKPADSMPPDAGGDGDRAPAPMRVLVMDDSALIRRIVIEGVSSLKTDEGSAVAVDVVEVANASRARALIEADQMFDLLICSWRLPGLEVTDYLQEYRDKAAAGSLRALILATESCDPTQREKFAGLSARILDKPFDMESVARSVAGMLSGKPETAGIPAASR